MGALTSICLLLCVGIGVGVWGWVCWGRCGVCGVGVGVGGGGRGGGGGGGGVLTYIDGLGALTSDVFTIWCRVLI